MGGEAAFGGCVDGEDDFARVLRERIVAAFLVFGGELVEIGCGGHCEIRGGREGAFAQMIIVVVEDRWVCCLGYIWGWVWSRGALQSW